MKDAATTCLHLLTYAEPLVRDLSDEHLSLASEGKGKTAGWLLGHLCVTGDFVRRKCGRPPLTPKDWGPRFAPGTQPSRAPEDYPTADALRAAFDGIYRDLAAFTPALSVESLAMPSPYEPGRARFATLGEFTKWIMTGHLGYHLGQLYGCRGAVNVAESREIVG